ncbi:MAG: rhomboid family intramembrane serine protease, partial [Candidatus Thorarchaeota archaeon]|nr:rhomboid family intramembrane serine protease [Phycisphaerae bacterium]NIW13083.1 rhomboid family intramembrane serine protease [Candidatus Thorarchaeota archaeon]NIX27374.1 rhomboid family intramembrane serine protease [Phycisphaerae bacterium]
AIFAIQLSTPGYLVCDYAVVPTDILAGKNVHTLLTSMFLHGGWMHLIGNML